VKALDWLCSFYLPSRERQGDASRSERRRWFKAGNIIVNAEPLEPDEEMDFPLISVVLFPKGKRITLL
jgi:hypothetical protein